MLARKPQALSQVLPDLLRDLGAPFPQVWDHLHATQGPRASSRRSLGELDPRGAAVVVPALTQALAAGAPLPLAFVPVPGAVDLVVQGIRHFITTSNQ